MEKLSFKNYKNIWLFLPCHNEEENLKPLVEKIIGLNLSNLHIAIINDASLDKTGEIANKLASKYKARIKVVHRKPPRGRALAGKTGYIFCLKQNADVIIEMDADFSHSPGYIPIFLNELRKGKYDVILGSRFVKGGRDSERDPFRTLVSKLSGVFLRLLLGIKLMDIGSGYKVYKRKALEAVKPNQLFSQKGLAISMESIFRVVKAGYKVKEMPIIFEDRRAGKSKLTYKDFFEPIFIAFKLVIKLGRV